VNHAGSEEVNGQEVGSEEVNRCQEGCGHEGEVGSEEDNGCQEGCGHESEEVNGEEVNGQEVGRKEVDGEEALATTPSTPMRKGGPEWPPFLAFGPVFPAYGPMRARLAAA
jgi:hypothetical protein